MNNRALELIDVLKLTPHPEGGYYREIYRSESKLIS
ncbi:cupin domain-containing protein, partial [bacterium]|nr:cupin domain-containing protein [bacterium]